MTDTPEKPEPQALPDTVQVEVGKVRALYNPDARLVFSYRGEDIEMAPDMRVFLLGRSPESNIVVDATCTSREHARVVYRKGKFVLVDQSTNGTFVRQAGASEILLVQDDEFPLTSAGVIGLGQSTQGSADELIRYRCERCSPVFL
ncbi:MAG: FHA domain-containing protein [Chromatiales bacterium]|jgi:hypothetical protein